MNTFLYIFLGMLDSLSSFVLMFAIFSFPLRQYFKEVAAASLFISLVSYLNRNVLSIQNWDMAVQFFFYIAILVVIFKVALPYAIDLASVGYLTFIGIQFIVYPLLLLTPIVSTNDAQELTGFGTSIIQITTDVVCYLVAFLIYRFNLGFSHISWPPHDSFLLYKLKGVKLFWSIVSTLAALAICSTMYWILNYHNGIYIVIPTVLGSLALLLYFSYRRDYGQ
ncbi:hypothetical protein ACFC0X_24820 [Paenibacillus chitinolyticus]|uniref:hypothetical protein n=1 Tax=Paenibacillus chitinolyticus TaxID=79263 RepID=UPI0035DE79C6